MNKRCEETNYQVDQLNETLDSGFEKLNETLDSASEGINEKIRNEGDKNTLLSCLLYTSRCV